MHIYLRQRGYVYCQFLFVSLFVCLSVCQKDNSKSYIQIFLKFWGNVGHGISYKWFNFWGDLAGILDSGSLWNFRYHSVKGGTREPLQNRRWWRHLANSIALAEVPASYDCFLVYCVPGSELQKKIMLTGKNLGYRVLASHLFKRPTFNASQNFLG